MKYKFSKQNRITHRHDFRLVSTQGEKIHTPYFTLYIRKGVSSWPKLGISARKTFGKAHQRNYFKRRIRDIFRKKIPYLPQDTEIHIKLNYSLKENPSDLYTACEQHLEKLTYEKPQS